MAMDYSKLLEMRRPIYSSTNARPSQPSIFICQAQFRERVVAQSDRPIPVMRNKRCGIRADLPDGYLSIHRWTGDRAPAGASFAPNPVIRPG